MDYNEQREIQNMIDASVKAAADFKIRKIGDIPSDIYQLTNRQYVDLNGVTSSRPISSIAGQQYFDTKIGRPVYWNPSIMTWVDGAGSIS